MNSKWIAIGAFWAALAVGLGAFGAHGLKQVVEPELLETWHTGVLYHVLTALGLVLYGLFQRASPARGWPAALLFLGSAALSRPTHGLCQTPTLTTAEITADVFDAFRSQALQKIAFFEEYHVVFEQIAYDPAAGSLVGVEADKLR